MQHQISSASLPSVAPSHPEPTPAPRLVTPASKPPYRRGFWLLLVLALGAGLVGWARQSPTVREASGQSRPVLVRSATVSKGVLSKTIRLSGTTGAEKFVSLVTPQLRGSRSRRNADASSTQLASIAAPLVVQSNARTGVGGGSSASTATASSDGSVSSTAGSTRSSGSQAFQSATSRVSRSSTSSTSSSTTSTTANSSTSTANGGLGSTASNLQGTGFAGAGGSGGSGGGGGRSGGDFSLVLQDAAKPGSMVRKGQVIAEFDRQYMLTRLDDYRASVSQQEDAVKKLRAELGIARKAYDQKFQGAKADLDKARLDVKTAPVLSAIEGERVRLAAEEAEARFKQVSDEKKFVEIGYASQLKNAEIDLEQAALELKRAEHNADRMVVKAPIEGLAVMQTIFRGSEFGQVQAGDQLWPGMMFMQVVDSRSMVVNATANQVDVESLRIGQKAKIRVDAYPGLEVPAHIHSIGAMTRAGGMRASFVKEIPIVIKIDHMDPRIIPDLSVSADVVIESQDSAVLAPREAIFRDGSNQSWYSYVKNGEVWDRRAVQVGGGNNTSVAVVSGLQPGEVVALEVPANEGKSS